MSWSRYSVYKEVFFTVVEENEIRKVLSDPNFLNKYSRVIDKAVKLMHKHLKYKVIKVHVNIKYHKYMLTQTAITK